MFFRHPKKIRIHYLCVLYFVIINFVVQPRIPVFGRRPQQDVSRFACLTLSSARWCLSSTRLILSKSLLHLTGFPIDRFSSLGFQVVLYWLSLIFY